MSILSLFDMSGHAIREWSIAGETCFCLDILNDNRVERYASGGSITFVKWDARTTSINYIKSFNPQFILSFAPCTDLAGSGAKHYITKLQHDDKVWNKAMTLVKLGPNIADMIGVEWLFENPVGKISDFWRQPDFYFDPCDYGGWLPPDDKHPEYPKYIPANDAYTKRTGIWKSKGLIEPKKLPVAPIFVQDAYGNKFSPQAAYLGGKSEKTKIIRSLSPRGFFKALFFVNYEKITGKKIPEWFFEYYLEGKVR